MQAFCGGWAGIRPGTRIELAGLSREAVRRLAEASTIDADELYVKTAVNPFFVTETLATRNDQVPQTIRDAVLARAARLSTAGHGVLESVAVVPQRAEIWLLEALSVPAAAIVTRRLRELGERAVPRGPRPKTRANPHGLMARELNARAVVAAQHER